MKTELLMKSPLLALPLVALFFFLLVFLAVVIGTLLRKSYAPVAALPLDDEDARRNESESEKEKGR